MMPHRKPGVPERRALQLTEDLFAPEMFASDASSFSLGPGVITITLVSHRWDNSVPPGEQKRVVVGRLVLPVPGAQHLALSLYDFLQKNGLDPVRPADGRQVQ
jgi:hypothetical protein